MHQSTFLSFMCCTYCRITFRTGRTSRLGFFGPYKGQVPVYNIKEINMFFHVIGQFSLQEAMSVCCLSAPAATGTEWNGDWLKMDLI